MALSTTQYGYIVDPFVPFPAPDVADVTQQIIAS